MKLFSFRMRAISVFIFDTGMSTRRCFDPQALRIRVSMSAIGSVILMSEPLLLSFPWTWRTVMGDGRRAVRRSMDSRPSPNAQRPTRLPTRLTHAGDHPLQAQLAEANAAQTEAAQERARTAAAAAAIVHPHLELRLPLALFDHGFTGHFSTLN